MSNNNYLKGIGARIFSEANDLKRTVEAMATDLEIDAKYLQNIMDGKCKKKDTFKVIKKMEKTYPIDSSDLLLIQDDCENGTVYCSANQSKSTSRTFNRLDKDKNRTPFYEYRDTAMSKLSPFKPEWIKELRVVNDSNPYNLDVAYNNGHFMHQLTLFVGPVNFYYEVNGKKYCEEMNTGDSNYVTPYLPHTFTSRDATKKAYIVAITFGGDVRRGQKELYTLGAKRTKKYQIDIRDENKAISQLIKQHMNNENITENMLSKKINIKKLLNYKKQKNKKDIIKIAKLLNIEPSDLMVPKYQKKHEIVVCKKKQQEILYYPNKKNQVYKMVNMARANKMPNLKGFIIDILKDKIDKKDFFKTSLHNYIYNYGKESVRIIWNYDNTIYNQVLKTGDSIYIQPFINYGFENINNKKGQICIARVGGSINFCTQKELSYFTDVERVAEENKCWFS
jgi:methylphosphonate synthase